DRFVGDRSGTTSDPTTSECSIWGVAIATKAHTRNTFSRVLNRPFARGNVSMRQLLVDPFRPFGGMLLLSSACDVGNRCRTSRFRAPDQHKREPNRHPHRWQPGTLTKGRSHVQKDRPTHLRNTR